MKNFHDFKSMKKKMLSEFRKIAMKTEMLRTHNRTKFLKAKGFYKFLGTKHRFGTLTFDTEIGYQIPSCISGVAFLT